MDPYRIALATVRLYAAVSLACGAALFAVCVAGVVSVVVFGTVELLSWVPMLIVYVVLDITSGLGMWVFSRPIARFAVKHFAS